jgi:hypothetical protein
VYVLGVTQWRNYLASITNAYVVSAQDLVLDPADTTYHVHFDRTSQVTFGKRYESVLVQALGW